MPPKNNIELGSGQLYFGYPEGWSEPINISASDMVTQIELADDKEYLKIRDFSEATFGFDLASGPGWSLLYCHECHQPFPVTTTFGLMYGTSGWLCPLCSAIKRVRERTCRDA